MNILWKINLLGGLTVEGEAQVITRFRTHRAAVLLAYLAYHREQAHRREALIDLVWPDAELQAGRNGLSMELSSLRRQLEPPGVPAGAVLQADRFSVQLNPNITLTDVAEFEDALRLAEVTAISSSSAELLIQAVELYKGPLLPGWWEDWITEDRERLTNLFLRAAQRLSTHFEQLGETGRAIEYSHRGVRADPLSEEARYRLMRLYALVGQPAAALRHYSELEQVLRSELGRAPGRDVRSLAEEIARGTERQCHGQSNQLSVISHQWKASRRAKNLVVGSTERLTDGEGDREPGEEGSRERAWGQRGVMTVLLVEVNKGGLPETGNQHPGAQGAAIGYEGLLGPIMQKWRGSEKSNPRGSFDAVFARASDALACAVEVQQAWKAISAEALKTLEAIYVEGEEGRGDGRLPGLRMAMDSVEVLVGSGEMEEPVGSSLRPGDNSFQLASGLLMAAAGEHILCSEAAAALLRRCLNPEMQLLELGMYRLRHWPTPERLFAIYYPGLGDFPQLNAERAYYSTLPLQLTRFFGREEELDQLTRLLQANQSDLQNQQTPHPGRGFTVHDPSSRIRLVTLTGPGGSGKTRLAVQAASRLLDRMQICFVSLGETMDAQWIPGVIQQVLRLPPSPTVEPLEQVINLLAREPALLVLDNLEHLIEGAAGLARTLLERIPSLVCLATSRRPLGLQGEHELAIGPLPVPEGEQTAERLVQCESVQLFVDRAQAVKPDFQVTWANAPAVGALCHRLEGIPLALELAAARIQMFSPSQMLAQLENRSDLLVGRKRDVPARHQSLRASLDWSYQLLPPDLQLFFSRLSVFRGGWMVGAAAAVAGHPNSSLSPSSLGHTLSEALVELQECSLIRVEEQENGETRFGMLETLREYAWERLGEEERKAVQQGHAKYFLGVVEDGQPALRGPEQVIWLARLQKERHNLTAAAEWAAQERDAEAFARLALALYEILYRGGLWREARQRLQTAWNLLESLAPEAQEIQAAVACRLSGILQLMGELPGARVYGAKTLSLTKELNDSRGIASALNVLGLVAFDEGDLLEAEERFEEALRLVSNEDHPRQAIALHNLARLAFCHGNAAGARELYQKALEKRRLAGDECGKADTMGALGAVLHEMGLYREARQLYEESLATCRMLHYRYGTAVNLNNLAELTEQEGDCQAALPLYQEAQRLFHEMHAPEEAIALQGLQRLSQEASRMSDQ